MQGIDLALDLVEGGAFRGDEHSAGRIGHKPLDGDGDPCGCQGVAGVDVQLKGADPVHGSLPQLSPSHLNTFEAVNTLLDCALNA
jgi:hypothetical protein